MHFYAIINKPFQVLSQFTREGNKLCLKDFFTVPLDVYSVGRLDYDSEGLLLLTNDTSMNALLLHPTHGHEREYWVQVEGSITEKAIQDLRAGLIISINGKEHRTQPCKAATFEQLPLIWERQPPIRYRASIPTSWIRLSLTEGKNRQVRKMTAAVGFPTLRLIRHRIQKCTLEGMAPGDMRILTKEECSRLFFK